MRPLLPVCLVLLVPALASAQQTPLLRLPLAEMEFADKKLGETVRRLHAAAEKMAAKWQRKPFEELNLNVKGVYYAQWSSVGFGDSPHPWNDNGPGEVNFVTLGAFFRPDPSDPGAHLKILSTRLDARWKPAGAGWSAKVEYQTHPDRPKFGLPLETFTCLWYHGQEPGKWKREESWRIDFYPAGQLFGGISFGANEERTGYVFGVREKNWRKKTAQAMPIADIWKILATPESLRDYLVAEYTWQLQNIDDPTQPDRGLVIQAVHYEAKAVNGRPVPSPRKLSEDEKTQIFDMVKAQVRGNIAAVKSHYRALHAAAEKAFPLRKCLTEN